MIQKISETKKRHQEFVNELRRAMFPEKPKPTEEDFLAQLDLDSLDNLFESDFFDDDND